ncbi:hypothetical protein FDENT_1851 [Fusarium denticulatum]|uniref:Uncharacterized protein n=1 Tax=Fusarium denticulatum TaxID=48507 RepID=A0A8H5XHH1_9HYPO|nr:hypothetical protein FDENT_1851 [Fusarium denticulatum]
MNRMGHHVYDNDLVIIFWFHARRPMNSAQRRLARRDRVFAPIREFYGDTLLPIVWRGSEICITICDCIAAIQAALDKSATIISMSWTLPIETGKDDMKQELHAVLKRAVGNKVLMFCSAPDKSKFTELDYPSGPWPNSFFRIGAAMIIYCVKVSILSVKTANQNKAAIHPIPDDRAIQVAKLDAMKRAFASLGSTTSNKFIQVWEELEKARVILERWEGDKSIPEANLKCTQEFMQFSIKLASSVKQ